MNIDENEISILFSKLVKQFKRQYKKMNLFKKNSMSVSFATLNERFQQNISLSSMNISSSFTIF
ncbi:hypothetical protein EMCG_05462 [[Emmonsia] crescens]|uniref:Uncharacterized protein n=1 Tax=[Emmonsia] crescens TaxID=73230 RepID=A0A0G2HNT9_9EURO|nr:hypothetical protein EMCG_05462 [Emmonsia crescens UAMH 3008]